MLNLALSLKLHLVSLARRSPELCPAHAPRPSRSERQPHGCQCGRHRALHAGPQLHHGPHLPRLGFRPFGHHGEGAGAVGQIPVKDSLLS